MNLYSSGYQPKAHAYTQGFTQVYTQLDKGHRYKQNWVDGFTAKACPQHTIL